MHEIIYSNHVKTDEQAEIALALIKKLPNIKYEDIYWAARESKTMELAQSLLQRECEICLEEFPRTEIEPMIMCNHHCCRTCWIAHFTTKINNDSINNCTCPFCNSVSLADDDQVKVNYFGMIDPHFRRLLDSKTYELFQTKVMDSHLTSQPNFKYCITPGCQYGYVFDPNVQRIECPVCGKSSCVKCDREWERQHQNYTCEQFANWKENNSDDHATNAKIDEILKKSMIQCPKCKFRYALDRGGCMHFTCTQCNHEFCSGCNSQYYKRRCNNFNCTQSGLHCHCPRNCYTYLRDHSLEELERLLTNGNVRFDRVNMNQNKRCTVALRDAMKNDHVCDKKVAPNQHGLCADHYKEYLGDIINKNNIDPLPVMAEQRCLMELRRYSIVVPVDQSMPSLRNAIKCHIPLAKLK